MKAFVLAALLTALSSAAWAADPEPPPAGVRPHLDEDAIRKAVRDTLAERPENPRLHEADTLRANRYDIFARQVEDATVPDCLHADGLKRQPTFFLTGLLALPFVAVAKIRGKCQ
ncbi:hypothetical protein SAMN05428966_1088 [Massilia sp. PDC64]|nr:hypothetical protein [Massilia sp. PDC64]SDE32706.1 hypothetical protein SAMN05428966_1088 [Massilia sp. PDC64]